MYYIARGFSGLLRCVFQRGFQPRVACGLGRELSLPFDTRLLYVENKNNNNIYNHS